MKITKDFFKHVPREKQQAVLERLQSFSQRIAEANVFRDIPKGFWIRKVAGTNIYKFRVNSGDRILFTFNDDGTVTYLSFETHDNQIRAAKNLTSEQNLTNLQINFTHYENETIDEVIDEYVHYELASKLIQIEQNEVLEDEYITLMIEDEQLAKDQIIFTREQFDCLKAHDTFTIILGCAGSGKTNIALRKIQLLQDYHPVDYVTHSPYLMNDMKIRYEATQTNNNVNFYSLAELFEQALNSSYSVIYEEDFYNWLISSRLQSITSLLPEELYAEISTVLKGETTDKIMSEQQYMQLEGPLTRSLKREVYHISRLYERWLIQNNYVDLNDLAYHVLTANVSYDHYIIIDEIQELTKKQLASVSQLLNQQQNALFLGDTYQALSNYLFHSDALKSQLTQTEKIYNFRQMNKNFRSGDYIIDLLNHIKAIQKLDTPHKETLYEVAIRPSAKPKIMIGTLPDFAYTNIGDDIDAIIIVPTFEEKKNFLQKGIQRVFTMKEVQGLQYKRVYCYNLLQYVHASKNRNTPFLNLFFNSLYVATSRAIFDIVFIEEKENDLLDASLFDVISGDHLVITKTNNILKWLDEGKKLERLGKFLQAIDAYKKANASGDVSRCKAILNRKSNNIHVQNYTTVIKFDFALDSPKKIQQVLEKLREYNLQLKGSTRSYRQLTSGKIEYENLYISSMTIEEISKQLFSLHNIAHVNRHSLVLCGVLYEQNEPISLAAKWRIQNAENYGLHCHFTKEGNVQIKPLSMPNETKLGALRKKFYGKDSIFSPLKDGLKLGELIEQAPKNLSADDILNDILS